MKAISICQPWASLIVLGLKRIENRSWRTAHRGRLAIHASARPDADGITLPDGLALDDLPLGAIVGTVELVDCVPIADLPAALRNEPHAQGPICWILSNPRPLAEPVPCKGKLKLWDVSKEMRLRLR